MARASVPAITAGPARAGIVDALTDDGQLVPPVPDGILDVDDAHALTERIRATARDVRDRVERLRMLLEQARTGDAWRVLGHASWTARSAARSSPTSPTRA